MKSCPDGRRQQLDLFTEPAEQRRAERLRRIAKLAASTHTTTAAKWFTEQAFQEATQRAQEANRGS